MKIITKLVLKAEKEIDKELKIINKDIADFTESVEIPSHSEIKKRAEYFDERMNGRLSSKQLTKNYSRKGKLERELREIAEFKWNHKDWFANEEDNDN